METRFDDLPNELIWFIMEYIPILELFPIFFNLNQRFNQILSSIKYQLNFSYINQTEYRQFLQTILPHIQIPFIESISIDDISNRLYTTKKFTHLRSLTIAHLRSDNLYQLARTILPDLKQLTRLRLYSEFVLNENDVNRLTDVILSDEMPSLTYCYLAFQDFGRIRFDHVNKTKQNLVLKTLIVDQWCRLRDFIQLLHFVPNIQRLTVRLYDSPSKDMRIPSWNTIDDFTVLVPNLIYLRAKLSQISFLMASKLLFQRLPSQLHELSLSTWSIDYANGESWQNLLSSKFPRLKHFRLIISLDQIPRQYSVATIADLDQHVQSFNQSKYFQDRHWHVLLNVNERDRLKFVLHTVPYPIENFQTTVYNTRRSTSTEIRSVYQNITKLTLTIQDEIDLHHQDQRQFSSVEHLVFLSNLSQSAYPFPSQDYFNHLTTFVNLSNIVSLNFPEESQIYPISLINLLLKNLVKLKSLTLSYQLYNNLDREHIQSLKTLTLIFTIYSSIFPRVTRILQLLNSNQILTNDLLLELVQTNSHLQILTILVRHFDGFDEQFSNWLKTNFSSQTKLDYDLILQDKIVRFYF